MVVLASARSRCCKYRTEATACQHFTCASESSVIQTGESIFLPGGALFAPKRWGPDLKSVYTSRQRGLIASLPPRIIGNLVFTSGTRLGVCAEPK